jgi:hypothetical protein
MAKRSTGKSDRCRPLREQIKKTEAEIFELQESLSDPDIAPGIKVTLRKLLAQTRALLVRLRAALKRCEALPKRPRLK